MARVALIFGGQSPEHEVSIVSARFVNQQLQLAGFDTLPVGIDRQGGWHPGPQAFDQLCKQQDSEKGLPFRPSVLTDLEADVVFPLIHGVTGEDGCIQGLCKFLGLPYVGGDSLNATLCWDKIATRTILLERGIPQLPYIGLHRQTYQPEETRHQTGQRFGYPVFVKPARTGSSIGISKVTAGKDLDEAVKLAFSFDYRVLIEPGLEAREIEVAGLGAFEPELSVPAEIQPNNDFYDFQEKYINGTTRFVVPAPMEKTQWQAVSSIAKQAWRWLNCYGMARIDFLITEEQIYLNEVNTCPGFTAISMYPKLLEKSGIPPVALMTRLVELAMDRDTHLARNQYFNSQLNWFKETDID